MKKRGLHCFTFLCWSFLSCAAYAQNARTPQPLAFEVATVKPFGRAENGRALPERIVGGLGTSDPGRITYANLSLQKLLLTAYEIAPYQLSAPTGPIQIPCA
jgi:hypothetical protein